MKKIITLLMVMTMTLSVSKIHAQFEDYTWMLLGYSALWYQAGSEKTTSHGNTSDAAKQMNLSLRTGAGIVLMTSIVAGLATTWTYDRYKYPESYEGGQTNINCAFAFGPFLRYYFLQHRALLLYAEAFFAMGVNNSITKYAGDKSKDKEGWLRAHLLVGASYFLSRAIALDLGIGYLWNRFNHSVYDNSRRQHQFMACVGLIFFLGNGGGLTNFGNY